ncbi:MAG TPA: hypothetical protein VGR64_03370, partial [Terracidiphilus sp.]|nr:hypothetical protein [Terracidiphilus sp.]
QSAILIAMTNPRREPDILPPNETTPPPHESDDPPSKGPSLVLLYSILAVVLFVAIALAALIVRPFALRAR